MNKVLVTVISILSAIILIAAFLFGQPRYKVWVKEMNGRAALAEAEQNRQILILEGRARKEAAKEYAEAEVIRAKGMAEAMKIENGQLNEVYNQYLMIRTLEKLGETGSIKEILYLPTNGGIMPTMQLNR